MADLESAREALRVSLTAWAVVSVTGDRALVLSVPDLDSLVHGLDRALDGGWEVSYALENAAPPVVRARLMLGGVAREGLAQGHTLADARLLALADALRAFGVAAADMEGHWVEYDSEDGANVHELEEQAPATASAAAPVAPPADPQLERAKQHISDLVDQLSGSGLGKQAALIVGKRGYGNTLEESREIYRELKALNRG